MKIRKKIFFLMLISILCLLSLINLAQRANADVKSDVELILNQIKDYDYGQNRQWLSKLADLVNKSIDNPGDAKQLEKSMLDFLKTDATFASKQFVCRQLSIIGTEDAVPTLYPMLIKKKTSDIARYALERIPGEKVNEALRKALKKTKKNVKVGIINTLGERRDGNSVEALGKLVFKSKKDIAGAAAVALGKIANDEAAEILEKAKDKTKGSVRLAVLDAYLKCADQFANNGETEKAHNMYKVMFNSDQPFAVRSAALRGLIRTSGAESKSLILDVLKFDNAKIQSVAIGLIRELPANEDISDVAAQLPNLPVSGKIQLLAAIADRGDPTLKETAVKALDDENFEVRLAALNVLSELGNAMDVYRLAEIAARGNAKEREAARETLSLLKCRRVDQTILSKIPEADADVKIELIRSVGARNIVSGVDVILETAKSPDEKIRLESLKTLEIIATPDKLPALIDLLMNAKNSTERKRAEKTVVTVANKISDKNQRADVILEKLPSVADVEVKSSLIRVLGKLSDNDALSVLRKALQSDQVEIKKAAIQALSDWQTPEPLNDLYDVIKNTKNETHKILALRGYIHLIGLESDRPEDEAIKLYQTAMNLATTDNEKRMVLSGLAKMKTISALNMVAGYLAEQGLKDEAEVAVVKIARSLYRVYPEETKEVLIKVAKATKSDRVRKDAQNLLRRIK